MVKFNITEAFEYAWEMFRRHWGLYTLILLGNLTITVLLYILLVPEPDMEDVVRLQKEISKGGENGIKAIFELAELTNPPIAQVPTLLFSILDIGWANICLQLFRGTIKKVDMTPYAMPVMCYVKVFAISIIFSFAVRLGTLILIVPGIFIFTRLMMAQYYALDHPEASIIESLSQSWRMTKGNSLKLVGMGIISLVVGLLGTFCCLIGFIPAVALTEFMMVACYIILSHKE